MDEAAAKRQQDYDASPPRCATCVYMRLELRIRYVTITKQKPNGKGTYQQQVRARESKNNRRVPRCTYGNFEVKMHTNCKEWRDRSGDRIAED